MVHKLIGWFAVAVGLLLAVHMGYQAAMLAMSEGARDVWFLVAFRIVLAAMGLALTVVGVRRLRPGSGR